MRSEAELREVWGESVYPPHVVDEDDRRRWDRCHQVATTMSETCESSGVADARFVWYTERSLYESDIPTDDAIQTACIRQ